jgi:hypothetical protein
MANAIIRECLSSIPRRRQAQAKRSFATTCVPKQELGNERARGEQFP